METVTLTAPDISCGHCKMTIERELATLPGVDDCRVSVDDKQVHITFDPARTSRHDIEERLDEEGYPVAG